MFAQVDQPGVGRVLTPRVPLSFMNTPAPLPSVAPTLGDDTDSVLERILGLTREEISRLSDRGIVGQK
jgi:2-methylfumaryl-CoA isomerase